MGFSDILSLKRWPQFLLYKVNYPKKKAFETSKKSFPENEPPPLFCHLIHEIRVRMKKQAQHAKSTRASLTSRSVKQKSGAISLGETFPFSLFSVGSGSDPRSQV